MMQQIIKVPVAQCDYPSQPRSRLDPDYCRSLGENMLAHGQKVPVIGYWRGNKFILGDGGCRLNGARQVGMTELLALDLGKEPTRLELLVAQASIDLHRQHLPAIDRARLFQSICKEQGCTARHLAGVLHVSEALISRSLALLQLPDELQRQVNEGTLDAGRGYLLSQEADPDRQRQLAAQAGSLSREELARHVGKRKRDSAPQVRVKRIAVPLPCGVNIVASGQKLSLNEFIDALGDALKAAKKARDEGLDATTFVKVMTDKSKAGARSA